MNDIKLINEQGDYIVLKEPTFEELIKLDRELEESEINDSLIENYFVREKSKPLSEFGIKEREQIYDRVTRILEGDGLSDDELLFLIMAMFYRTTPDQIRTLPGLTGVFMLKGMNLVNRYEKGKSSGAKQLNIKSISEFKPDANQLNEILKQFGVKM